MSTPILASKYVGFLLFTVTTNLRSNCNLKNSHLLKGKALTPWDKWMDNFILHNLVGTLLNFEISLWSWVKILFQLGKYYILFKLVNLYRFNCKFDPFSSCFYDFSIPIFPHHILTTVVPPVNTKNCHCEQIDWNNLLSMVNHHSWKFHN